MTPSPQVNSSERSTEAGASSIRSWRNPVAAIFLLAVAARLAYCLLMIPPDRAPAIVGNDDWQYDHLAVSLLSGRGMTLDGSRATARRMPGYPLFLAGVYGVFGHSHQAARVCQCFLGGAACVLLYLLAARWVSLRSGFVAAGILAVYPTHVWLAGEHLSENLTVPGLLLMLLALDWALRGGGLGRWLLAGGAMAAAGMVHPIVAGLGVVLGVGLTIMSIWPPQRHRRYSIVAVVMLALPLAGWMTRNHFRVGGFVLSSLGGSTLLGANNVITATDRKSVV